jgi:hypothetical protein
MCRSRTSRYIRLSIGYRCWLLRPASPCLLPYSSATAARRSWPCLRPQPRTPSSSSLPSDRPFRPFRPSPAPFSDLPRRLPGPAVPLPPRAAASRPHSRQAAAGGGGIRRRGDGAAVRAGAGKRAGVDKTRPVQGRALLPSLPFLAFTLLRRRLAPLPCIAPQPSHSCASCPFPVSPHNVHAPAPRPSSLLLPQLRGAA